MTKVLTLRGLLAATVALSAACGGRSSLTGKDGASNDGAPSDAGTGGGDVLMRGDGGLDVSGDGRAAGADAMSGAVDAMTVPVIDAGPPSALNLPGIVVWLDADTGIEGEGTDHMTWTDRSPFQHVFVAQASGAEMPTLSRVNGHRAVRFNGHNRFISEQVPSAAQERALALGQDFTVAMAFLTEHQATGDAILTTAMLPWIDAHELPVVLLPPSPPTFSIVLQADSALSFQAGETRLKETGDFVPSFELMILSTAGGNQLRVRLNDQVQTLSNGAVPDPAYGDYAPVFLGAWDFDSFGFQGIVAEMIIVRGAAADPATEQALADYFKAKFFP